VVASEVGLGAGASAAATFWTAETAMSTTTIAKNTLIFNASIVKNFLAGKNRGVEGEEKMQDFRQRVVGVGWLDKRWLILYIVVGEETKGGVTGRLPWKTVDGKHMHMVPFRAARLLDRVASIAFVVPSSWCQLFVAMFWGRPLFTL